MPVSPLAGNLPPKELLIDTDALMRRVLRAAAGPGAARAARQLRHERPPRHAARTGRSTRRTSSRSRRRSASTASPGASTARCSSARTRTPPISPATRTALEVLAANGVETVIARGRRLHADAGRSRTRSSRTTGAARAGRAWPTGSSSRRRTTRRSDGGIKYNPPHGGPADVDVTKWIQDRANALLEANNAGVQRRAVSSAR